MQKILFLAFWLHDWSVDFLVKHLRFMKMAILLVAHLSLFGFFFPELRKSFGSLAGDLLIGILFISPLSRIFRIRLFALIVALRRELGILMAYLATVHGLGYILDPTWFQVTIAPFYAEWHNGYIFGILAYALTLPLLLTSNSFSVKHIGSPTWKIIHRTVYTLFVFAILHRFFIKTGSSGRVELAVVESTILIGGYIIVRLLAWKNFLPPLRKLIEWVSVSYKEYKTLS